MCDLTLIPDGPTVLHSSSAQEEVSVVEGTSSVQEDVNHDLQDKYTENLALFYLGLQVK